ncbi:MAG: hypothetical protein WAT79_13050 [Saprospiraceae bacterium]
MREFKIFFLIILVMGSLKLSGQAIFLEKGESGTNIGVGYFGIGTQSSVYGGIGYSPNGVLNFGVNIGKSSFDNIDDYGEFYILPYLEYYFIKEDSEIPISVGAGIGYQRTTDTGGLFDDLGIDLTANSFSGSVIIVKNVNAVEKIRLLPFLEAQYGSSKATLSDGVDKETFTDDSFIVSLGVIGAIKVQNNYFNIAPKIVFNKSNTGFSIFLSYNINK